MFCALKHNIIILFNKHSIMYGRRLHYDLIKQPKLKLVHHIFHIKDKTENACCDANHTKANDRPTWLRIDTKQRFGIFFH